MRIDVALALPALLMIHVQALLQQAAGLSTLRVRKRFIGGIGGPVG